MLLSEHVYCVAITFKMTKWVEQWICIKFCVKLQHYCVETWRPQLWATGDWQLHHNKVLTHASCLVQSFWQNIKSPRWLSPPTAQIWHPETSGFSQTKITFERKEISHHWWDSGKYNWAIVFGNWENGNWEKCVGPYFEGDQGAIVLCTMFLLFCIFFNKCI